MSRVITSKDIVAFGDTAEKTPLQVFKDSCLCTQNAPPAQTFKDSCMCSQQEVVSFRDSCLCTQHELKPTGATSSDIVAAMSGGTIKTLADFGRVASEIKAGGVVRQ